MFGLLSKFFRIKPYVAHSRSDDGDAIPFVEIAFTNACNLECVHCSRLTLEDKGQEITNEVLLRFLSEFAEQGGRYVCFTGGEPLSKRSILYPAIKQTTALGMSASIISNGQLLTDKVVAELKEKGLGAVGISLDGKKKFHDAFVQLDGAYEKSLEAIKRVKAAGISCQIMAVPTNESMEDGNFQHLLDVGRELEVPVYVNFPTVAGALKDLDCMLLNKGNLEKLYEMGRGGLIRKDVIRDEGRRGCPAPHRQIYLTPWGDLCPCPFIQLGFGNIFKESLAQIKQNIKKSGYLDKTYNCCPPAEDRDFIDNVIGPIYEGGSVPMHYSEHPRYQKSSGSESEQ